MNDKPLPIGIDDFKKLITTGYYYVDKTLLIKELLDKKGEVNLFTRPRRFGKTLNISMLRYFYEDTGNREINTENRELFNDLNIMSAGEKYTSQMQQYPVISLSLKSAKQPTWELAYACLRETIENEYQKHKEIGDAIKVNADRTRFYNLVERTGNEADYVTSLAFLSKCLYEYYGKSVIILIDEYDVPLENAYFGGFYQQMTDFMRSLFESALKTNPYLHFAVITGCLRITKESIFTGLNNLKINSILGNNYGEYFGFTPKEVKTLLADYDQSDFLSQVKKWYDGYTFGKSDIYNPWSVLNYIDNEDNLPRAYWSNTSSNNIVRTLVEKADLSVRTEIEDLIAGNTIEKPVHEEITYQDVYTSEDNLWNFLFFTGYLRNSGKQMRDNELFVKLSIPNTEVRQIYKTKILGWFRETIEQKDMSVFYQDILNGNAEGFQNGLTQFLQETISFYDNAEAFYHGLILGTLSGLKTHIIKSNRESGDGRFDIMIRSLDIQQPLIIIELKIAESYRLLDAKAKEALEQIEKLSYDREFAQEGYQKSIRYGVAFYKKICLVQKEELDL